MVLLRKLKWKMISVIRKKMKNSERIKSIDKALNLLEHLSSKEEEIGIAKLSKELNLALSTVHRILTTLKSRKYIIQNPQTKKYRLGIKLFALGCEVQGIKNLIKLTKPHLENLSQITNETSNLAILEGKEVIYLDTIESSEVLRTEIIPGTRTPAHCAALGKALLAFLSDNEFNGLYSNNEPLLSLTSKSISSLDELKNKLKEIRIQGYALDLEEYKIGINCIGVPIFGRNGETIAAISITGPASRFTLDEMEKVKDILMTISQEISNQL